MVVPPLYQPPVTTAVAARFESLANIFQMYIIYPGFWIRTNMICADLHLQLPADAKFDSHNFAVSYLSHILMYSALMYVEYSYSVALLQASPHINHRAPFL